MLTIFSTPKPFRGHIGVIQRNAIQSWKRINPDVEIILFGDEEGAAEVSREFGLRHVPDVPKNEFGTKLLRGFFEPAQQMARHAILCYVNCDIMLLPAFAEAVRRTASIFQSFLMVGQRWDTDISEPWNFGARNWDKELASLVKTEGALVPPWSIDYFVFRRGLYRDMPELVVGRVWWDHWLVWKARSLKTPVVDASLVVQAVHQNHDYSYHLKGAAGVWNDEQAAKNLELTGGRRHLYTIEDATHRLTETGVKRNWKAHFAPTRRALRPVLLPAWFKVLDLTRPLRTRLGIRQKVAYAGRAISKTGSTKSNSASP
jgi:hypothetical protein